MPSTYLWPNDEGWPYPDTTADVEDPDAIPDEDVLLLRAAPPRLYDDLDALERRVLFAHYGLDGQPPRSVKELHTELGMTRGEVRDALVGALAKLRDSLGT